MKEMYKGVVNSPETTITNDISSTDTLIYVLDETRVPDDLPNLMTIGTGTNAETIKVVSKAGSAITVVRGFQGIAKPWPTGSIIARNFTEYDYNTLIENIDTLRQDVDTNEDDILSLMNYVGDLESLDTDEKANIVLALNETYQNLVAHKEESATQAHLAKNIALEDASGNFTASDVEGALSELFTNVSNGKNEIATAITDKGVSASGSESFLGLSTKIGQIETDQTGDATAIASDILLDKTAYARGSKLVGSLDLVGDAAAGDVIKGKTFYNTNPKTIVTGTLDLTGNATAAQVLSGRTFYNLNPKTKLTGTMPNIGAVTKTITTQGGSYTIPAGYHSGSGKVKASLTNLVASNIRSGVSVGGVTGTFKGGWNVTLGSLYDGTDNVYRVSETVMGYRDDTGFLGFRVDVPGITSSSTVHAVLITRVKIDNITEDNVNAGPWHWSNDIYRGSGELPYTWASDFLVCMNNVTSSAGYIKIYYDWRIRYRDGKLRAEVTMYSDEEEPILVIWS